MIFSQALFGGILVLAALAAYIEWKQRSGWAPILLVIAIALAFAVWWLAGLAGWR